MNENKIFNCPACKSEQNNFYIETNALMHNKNEESYIFNRCSLCATVFLTNPVHEDLLNNYYSENYLPYLGGSAWGKYKSFVLKSQENLDLKRLKVVSSYVNKNESFSILDIGCGNPSFLNILQKKIDANCTGIDFCDKGWKDKNYKNITLIKSTIAEFDTDKKFDIITLWHYLEHDYNLQSTVDKLHQCLDKGGKLIIEVPDYDNFLAKKQKQYWQGWHSPRHLTLLSKNGFENLFETHKWTFIKHSRFGTLDAFTLWWLGKMEKKKIDWADSMENEFWPLVFLKVFSYPFFVFETLFPMGIQMVVLQKK